MSLPKLILAPKAIPYAAEWSRPDQDDGYIRYHTSLDLEGVTEAGLTLFGGTYVHHPDRHISFELAVEGHGGNRRIRLARIDWKSIRDGHSNSPRCPGPWAGKRVPETHFHRFELNWSEAEQRMKRGKLPCAEPIDEPIQTFEDLRVYVGIMFNINNINVVPRPDWVYDLFK